MKNTTGGQRLFVRQQKYGFFDCLNGHKIFTLSRISLKLVTIIPCLEFKVRALS